MLLKFTMCVMCLLLSSFSYGEHYVLHFYQKTPPFETAEKQGMYYDLVAYIDQQDPDNSYELQFMPRARLNKQIEFGLFDSAIIGANPAWFDDVAEDKFLWTRSVLHDANEVISNLNNPVEYDEPASLVGMRLGGIRGYYYVGIDSLVAQGKIEREDVNQVQQNIQKVIHGRFDVALVNRSFVDYYLTLNKLTFYISKKKHSIHSRHIMFSKKRYSTYVIVDEILRQASQNGDLKKLLNKYNYSE